MKYEVLEEWSGMYTRERLAVTPEGHIKHQWRGALTGMWWPSREDGLYGALPLFGTTKTPRRPAKASPRRTRSRPASSPPLATARRAR